MKREIGFVLIAACALVACPSMKEPVAPTGPRVRAVAPVVRDAAIEDAGLVPADGDVEANFDAGDASPESALAIVEADAGSKSTTSMRPVEIAGLSSFAIHDHGGDAAKLREARFQVINRTKADATIRVKRVEYLVGHSCTELPTRVSKEPKATSEPIVIHSAESREVEISFEPVEAYYSYCQRFFFRVTFQIGREERVVLAETKVSRVSPMRR